MSTGLYPAATGPLLLSAFSFLTGVSPVAGRVSFLTAAYFAEFHNRVIATLSVAVVAGILFACFTFHMFRLVLLLCAFDSTFQSLVVIAVSVSKSFAVGGVQNFIASRSSSELSSHRFPLGAPRGQEVQNFSACCSSSELSSHQISLTAHSDVCAKSRFQSHESSTTIAKGLSYCVHHQVHSPRHRRRRGTTPAHAGSPPLQHISAVWSCCFRLAPSGRPPFVSG